MRLHIAVAMPEEGGRPSVIATEVFKAPDIDGRRRWHFFIGHAERVASQTVEGAHDAVTRLVERVADAKPCVFVDIGTPQGLALRRTFRADWPVKSLHLPHAYERTARETAMFAAFLEAYADGRVRFADGMPFRKDLDKALVLYRGGHVSKAAEEMPSEDESLVVAACLSLMWPSHGPDARAIETSAEDLATNES